MRSLNFLNSPHPEGKGGSFVDELLLDKNGFAVSRLALTISWGASVFKMQDNRMWAVDESMEHRTGVGRERFGAVWMCTCPGDNFLGHVLTVSTAMISLAWVGFRVAGTDRSAYGGDHVLHFSPSLTSVVCVRLSRWYRPVLMGDQSSMFSIVLAYWHLVPSSARTSDCFVRFVEALGILCAPLLVLSIAHYDGCPSIHSALRLSSGLERGGAQVRMEFLAHDHTFAVSPIFVNMRPFERVVQ